jgi:hypothetical protein
MWLEKRGAVRANSKYCHPSGPETSNLARQPLPSSDQFLPAQFICPGSGTRDNVGQAIAMAQQEPILVRRQNSRRESRPVQHRPKTVTGTGEVVPHGSGIEARVDAAEEHL